MLEGSYQEFGELFGRWPVESGRPKIRVVLYRRAGFHEATGIGHWAVGLYDGTIRVPVENLGREKDELARVLRHEIVHAFVAESGGSNVPGWLNEGLAQWLESGSLQRQSAAVRSARKKLAQREILPLAKLQKSLGDQKDADAIAIAYAQGLAFTAYIESTYGERVLFEMVAGCKAGVACEPTFKNRAGVALDDALADFARDL